MIMSMATISVGLNMETDDFTTFLDGLNPHNQEFFNDTKGMLLLEPMPRERVR